MQEMMAMSRNINKMGVGSQRSGGFGFVPTIVVEDLDEPDHEPPAIDVIQTV